MPVPDPLPARFEAALATRLRALFVHDMLDDGRALVEEPVDVRVAVEGDTLRLVAFPEVEGAVETAIGKVGAAVSVEGQPEGSFDAESGRVEIEVPVHLDAKHLLASDSDVRLALSTAGSVDEPELAAEGDPFDAGDPVVRLVGHGTLEGGSLDGGTLVLVLDAEVRSVEAA